MTKIQTYIFFSVSFNFCTLYLVIQRIFLPNRKFSSKIATLPLGFASAPEGHNMGQLMSCDKPGEILYEAVFILTICFLMLTEGVNWCFRNQKGGDGGHLGRMHHPVSPNLN